MFPVIKLTLLIVSVAEATNLSVSLSFSNSFFPPYLLQSTLVRAVISFR